MMRVISVSIGNFLLVLSAIFLSVSCYERRENKTGEVIAPDREAIEEVNRYLVQKDRERIENYIERRGLNMQMTSSGLWYMITDSGSGSVITSDDRVLLDYSCGLLDGTGLYSSDETGPKEVVIGKSNIESGLDEGLRMLRGGSEATFIIPSYLAHGLLGDGDRVPPRSVVVYQIRIIRHKNIDY